MIKILKHLNSLGHPHPNGHSPAYLIQSVPASEVLLSEIACYGNDENVDIELDGEWVHIIKRQY